MSDVQCPIPNHRTGEAVADVRRKGLLMRKTIAAVAAAVVLLSVLSPLAAEVDLKHKWVYVSTNLLVDKNVDELLPLMERIQRCGYSGILLADYKFSVLDRQPERYFRNARRVIAKAKELDLEIIPAVFPIGYSSGILAHDPTLIEGVPVVDAPFEVRRGELHPLTGEGTRLVNGDFEQVKGGRFTGWWQENVGKSVFADRDVVKSGRVSVRMQDIRKHSAEHGHCRLHQLVKTRPFTAWHLSVWIRTEDFETPRGIRLAVLGNRRKTLSYAEFNVKRTQDWRQYHAVFNSLECDEARIYCGVWKGGGGKLWWDGLRMEPAGFVNVIRRDGCPVKVTSADGRTTYTEGRDVSRIMDPKLGRMPGPGAYG